MTAGSLFKIFFINVENDCSASSILFYTRFATTPRAKSAKEMKQISPIAKTTITSAIANGAVVKHGVNSKQMIKAINSMLA